MSSYSQNQTLFHPLPISPNKNNDQGTFPKKNTKILDMLNYIETSNALRVVTKHPKIVDMASCIAFKEPAKGVQALRSQRVDPSDPVAEGRAGTQQSPGRTLEKAVPPNLS